MEDNIHFQRAQVLLEQNRYREAEKELLLALAQDPEEAEIYNDLSICRTEAKDYTKALEYIKKAVSLEPDNPNHLYSYSRTLYLSGNSKEASKAILEAISLFPYAAEYYNLAGRIEFDENNYSKSLEYANTGLEIDPENINCLNLRSSSLVKLNRKDEAFETIQDALYFDPENGYTHANLGWSTLEKGKAKDALVHFRNALKIDPTNQWAKKGMVEAMKGRYWIYNLFLKYTFWMSKHGKNYQWGIIIGFFIISNVVGQLSEHSNPLIIILGIFALLTWVMYPLSNLFLKLNPYGRYALSKEESITSNLVGGSLLTFIVGVVMLVIINTDWTLGLTVFGLSMMIPLSSMLNPLTYQKKRILVIYTIVTGLVGLATIIRLFLGYESMDLVWTYLFAIFIYQWVATYVIHSN